MTTWKILVADELSEEGLEILAQCGELTIHQGMSEDQLRSTLPSHHAPPIRS